MGAWKSANGQKEVSELFAQLEGTFSNGTTYSHEVVVPSQRSARGSSYNVRTGQQTDHVRSLRTCQVGPGAGPEEPLLPRPEIGIRSDALCIGLVLPFSALSLQGSQERR